MVRVDVGVCKWRAPHVSGISNAESQMAKLGNKNQGRNSDDVMFSMLLAPVRGKRDTSALL